MIRFQIVAPSSAQISTCGVTATTPASIRPEEIVFATAVPQSAPMQIRRRREQHGLTGTQHLGRDHGRDRIGGVVKAVDVLEDQRDQHDDEDSVEVTRALL